MYKDKRILCVVPARGGSKGIHLKNLRLFKGKSLVEWAGKTANEVNLFDAKIVSTDHPEIAKAASESGLEVPFTRPPEISGGRISDYEVLIHALQFMEERDQVIYDVVVMLQPTSPLRTAQQVCDVITKLVDKHFDSVTTISPIDLKNHPLKQLTFASDKLGYYDNSGKQIIARQQLNQLYIRNGIAYAMTRDCLYTQKTVIGEAASAIVIDDLVINIDSEFDLILGEALSECHAS